MVEKPNHENIRIDSDSAYKDEVMNISVLVAEDEIINYRLMECMLKKMVSSVQQARNGQEVIDLASKNHYDIVFMDMNMPVMGGIEATKILREMFPKLPIIALTASLLPEDICNTIQAGCNEFVFKPTKRDILKSVLIKYSVGC